MLWIVAAAAVQSGYFVPSVSYYMHPLMKQEWNHCLLYQQGSEDCPA